MKAPLNPTDIARETFRQLASHRIAPAHKNYRDPCHRIGGHVADHGSTEEEKDLDGSLGFSISSEGDSLGRAPQGECIQVETIRAAVVSSIVRPGTVIEVVT